MAAASHRSAWGQLATAAGDLLGQRVGRFDALALDAPLRRPAQLADQLDGHRPAAAGGLDPERVDPRRRRLAGAVALRHDPQDRVARLLDGPAAALARAAELADGDLGPREQRLHARRDDMFLAVAGDGHGALADRPDARLRPGVVEQREVGVAG